MDKKYLLISVYERHIFTEQFNNFEDARNQMMKELEEELFNHDKYGEKYKEWLDISAKEEYEDEEDFSFAFDKDSAWSNIHDYYKHDWKIVEIN